VFPSAQAPHCAAIDNAACASYAPSPREGEPSYTVWHRWRAVMVASVGERSLLLPALRAPVSIRAPPGLRPPLP